jgi:hypothetical protein
MLVEITSCHDRVGRRLQRLLEEEDPVEGCLQYDVPGGLEPKSQNPRRAGDVGSVEGRELDALASGLRVRKCAAVILDGDEVGDPSHRDPTSSKSRVARTAVHEVSEALYPMVRLGSRMC